ncbi:unnamed protein product [Auanema sp. JU1783]|nr:unnamed protein product [Auanema sp. JU1783]
MRFDWLERRIASGFNRYGHFLSNNPLPFVVFPLLVTLAMTAGFLHLDPLTDAVYLFTPLGSPSKYERQAIHEKWPLTDDNYIPGRAVTQSREIQVTALARNGGNILESEFAEAVFRLDSYIQNRIRVLFKGKYYTYRDLCLQFKGSGCPGNKHIHILSDLYNHGFNITFPYFRFGTESGYLGSAMGGVSLMNTENGTSILAGARAWFMIYHLKFHPLETSYISGLWENELGRHLQNYPEDPYISITYFHSQTLADELKRNADSLVPRFVIAFTLLVIFSAICSISFIENSYSIDWTLSKMVLSVLGVVNAGMGIMSGIGLLLLCGMPYNDIVAVMPFLVVAVGTDNMFLMVASVRRTPRSHSVGERMGECMADAAVSILITASTDAFSFGVGAITTIPAVQIFCVYTGVAIIFAFFYQITFFAALLAIYTKYEEEGKNSVFVNITTVPGQEIKSASIIQRIFNMGSRVRKDVSDHKDTITEPITAKFFKNWFAPMLMNPIIRCISIAWFIIYLIGAYYGCTQLKEGLEPINLLVEDSYAIPHYKLLQEYFWKYGATLQIVVNNAPDMRNSTSRQRIKAMVGDMATTRHSIGMESVQFWMEEMERYYSTQLDMGINDVAFYGMLRHWLASKHNNMFTEDLVWGHDTVGEDIVTAFRFVIGMRDIASTTDQTDATMLFREVAGRWPEFNITTFMPLWLFTDQYVIIVPNTVQNIIIALFCMIAIAFFLIPQPMCALWVALACASIDFGVIGYMTLWGVNLDAISMITIIMSIGFSVDFSAHITYGYVVSPESDPKEKIRDALAALGWPLFQGGLSTIIAVSVLADIPAYMIVTFFKTVVISITLGLLHGLIFLPVLLSIFVRGCCIVDAPSHSPTVKAKVTPMLEKGSYYSNSSPSTGYGTGPSSINDGSPIAGSIIPPLPEIKFDSPASLSFEASPAVHNRSRQSTKSPNHCE